MTLLCAMFAILMFLTHIYTDVTYPYVRPWLSFVGLVVGIWGATAGIV